MATVRISKRSVVVSSVLLATGSLGGMGGLLYNLQRTIARQQDDLQQLQAFAERQRSEIDALDDRLGKVGHDLVDVRALEAEARRKLLAQIESRTGNETQELRDKLSGLGEHVTALRSAADEHSRLLAAARANEDVEVRYRELMSPTVRINARSEVGSGTIWWSKNTGGGRARTYVVTAWHVVQDNNGYPLEVDFHEDGKLIRTETGKIVAKNPALDLALVEVRGFHVYPHTARLPLVEDLRRIQIFSKVYAIGCPLGYSPLPTSGELTSKGKDLDGRTFWMINAPTIFGNSGGGIYVASSRTMFGVLSRISAYKNMIDVAVPHMGLVTPVDQVYTWLDKTRYAFVYRDRLEEIRIERGGRTLEASSEQGSRDPEAPPLPALPPGAVGDDGVPAAQVRDEPSTAKSR